MRLLPGLLVALAAGPVLAGPLDDELDRKKSELAAISAQIHVAATSPAFDVTRDIHASLKTATVQTWLNKVTTPSLVISAYGIGAENELIYKGGTGKAWIEQPQDTKAKLIFRPLQVTTASGELEVKTRLVAHAETRISLEIYNVKTNVFCQSNPDLSTDIAAKLAVAQSADGKVPYSVRITQPTSLKAKVKCGLGALGNYELDFPIDGVAGEVSKGDIDLGYASRIRLPLPTTPPSDLVMDLKTTDGAIVVDSQGVDSSVNVSVGPPQAVTR